MKGAAIGVRAHSGWGALVAVSHSAGLIEVLDRQRVTVTAPGTREAIQPYHFAEGLQLPRAEEFLKNCFASSKHLAFAALRDVVEELHHRQYRIVGSAILLASGRPLPALANILASHALIHAAEGVFFRDVFSQSFDSLGIPVTGFPERNLDNAVQATFGESATPVCQQISTLGRSLGPPWTRDQKSAALAALIVLEKQS